MEDENLQPELPMAANATDGQLPPIPDESIREKDIEEALRAVAKGWMSKLTQARKHKKPFSMDAKECMHFFDGSDNWFWDEAGQSGKYSKVAPPSFRMTINKVFEAVKLFGSVIYHRNPVRTVTPKKFPVVTPEALGINPAPPQPDPMTGMMPPPDPRMEQFIQTSTMVGVAENNRATLGKIMESYLNYTPNELDLKNHCRKYVDESIIKGMGTLWTELVETGGEEGPPLAMVGSFYDTVDNLLVDPDADELEDILWCARRCIHPVKDVADKYGLSEDDLKGHLESYVSRTEADSRDYESKKRKGKTNDLCVYWKIYSKTGFGHDLKGSPKEYKDIFDALGRNTYVVVAEGVDFPLNCPKDLLEEPPDPGTGLPNTLFTRSRWPIPFYADASAPWPFTPLMFHRKPGYSWPIAHMKPGLPELRFLNWALSFLATRVMVSCKTMVGVAKAAGDDIKDQILAHEQSGFSLVELSETLGLSVDQIISVMQMPEVNPEIFKIVEAVSEMFDKRVGLTELTYGLTRNQFRSAAEAQVKAEQISVRPDDMANVLEDALSLVSRKEALAARWLLQPDDVAPVIGPLGAMVWGQHVQTQSIDQIAREYDYRIEAGSARKPNKSGRVEQMQMALQTLGPILQPVAMAGVIGPMNALLSSWAESLDIDAKQFLLPPPPPPPQPPPGMTDSGEPPVEESSPQPGGGSDQSGNPVNVPEELIP